MISINELTKKKGNKLIINNVSINFKRNISFLTGENGSGKTTLIELIAGITSPTLGNIFIDCKKINFYNGNYKQNIGFVLDLPHFPYHLKINEFINLLFYVYNISPQKQEVIKFELINFFELSEHLEKKISELSKGYIQRVKILSSMIHSPAYYIYDEPFNGLDNKFKLKLFKKIRKLALTSFFLIVSHDENILFFESISDLFYIEHGKIVKI